MEPATLIPISLAIVFSLLTMLYWRRAADLEERVRELEAKLDALEPEEASAQTAADEEAKVEETQSEPSQEPQTAAEEEKVEEQAQSEEHEESEKESEPEEAAAEQEPAAAASEEMVEPEQAPPPKREPEPVRTQEPPEPDPLRLAALKVVSEAFELARYLDFDAIVEKPSTYRVTVPMTAANGNAIRYLQQGMFACLKEVLFEDDTAVLHIDTSKGPP